MKIRVEDAATQLEHLIERVLAGERVFLARGDGSVVEVVPAGGASAREFGFARGIVNETPGWEAPLSEQECSEMFDEGRQGAK